jgi:hypothetical protein
MEKQPQSGAPLIIAIVLLLLPALYARSYLALVVPGGIPRQGIGSVNGIVNSSISRNNHYRIARSGRMVFLAPEAVRPEG